MQLDSSGILSQTMALRFATSASEATLAEAREAGAQSQRGPEGAAIAARKFEQLFATMLVKEMRRALPDGFFGGGAGSDIYDGWLDEHLGTAVAQDGGLGLEDLIKTRLIGSQGASPAAADVAPLTAAVAKGKRS